MKSLWKMLVLLMVLSVIVAFPAQVSAQPIDVPQPQDSSDGKVVFGGFYRLESGNTLNGGLVIFGGQGVLEEDSTVNGDVLLTGGSLNVAGEITGDLVAVGGSVDLGDHAVIRGDVTTIGAAINRSDGAVVEGTFSFEMPGNIDFGDAPQLLIPEFNFSPFSYFSEMWRGVSAHSGYFMERVPDIGTGNSGSHTLPFPARPHRTGSEDSGHAAPGQRRVGSVDHICRSGAFPCIDSHAYLEPAWNPRINRDWTGCTVWMDRNRLRSRSSSFDPGQTKLGTAHYRRHRYADVIHPVQYHQFNSVHRMGSTRIDCHDWIGGCDDQPIWDTGLCSKTGSEACTTGKPSTDFYRL